MNFQDVSNLTSNLVMDRRSRPRIGFVIHTTSGLDSQRWLQGDSAKSGEPASADYLITRSGTIKRITPEGYYAYHAGRSSLQDNSNEGLSINESYIGIEHENNDTQGQIVTDVQYQCCAEIIRRSAQKYGMSPIRLYGHANIALPPGRRSDPTRYDFGLLFHYATYPSSDMLNLVMPL